MRFLHFSCREFQSPRASCFAKFCRRACSTYPKIISFKVKSPSTFIRYTISERKHVWATSHNKYDSITLLFSFSYRFIPYSLQGRSTVGFLSVSLNGDERRRRTVTNQTYVSHVRQTNNAQYSFLSRNSLSEQSTRRQNEKSASRDFYRRSLNGRRRKRDFLFLKLYIRILPTWKDCRSFKISVVLLRHSPPRLPFKIDRLVFKEFGCSMI